MKFAGVFFAHTKECTHAQYKSNENFIYIYIYKVGLCFLTTKNEQEIQLLLRITITLLERLFKPMIFWCRIFAILHNFFERKH
jgi:fucose 4-O-acetylase-like acetyltransferase